MSEFIGRNPNEGQMRKSANATPELQELWNNPETAVELERPGLPQITHVSTTALGAMYFRYASFTLANAVELTITNKPGTTSEGATKPIPENFTSMKITSPNPGIDDAFWKEVHHSLSIINRHPVADKPL